MNRRTKIEWVKNPDGSQGYTWNPITGCLNHTPEGLCLGGMFPCYAFKLANGRLRPLYLGNPNVANYDVNASGRVKIDKLEDPFYPRFWEERVNNFPDYGRSKGVFICDMGELFGDWVPSRWQNAVFSVIRKCHWHRFYLLTKQPQHLAKWSPFPENAWVGVTATDKTTLARGLYLGLERIKATVKFISFEPLLEETFINMKDIKDTDVQWLIIGAQTKPYKPPKIEWVMEIVEAADRAGVPVFLKDNLLELVNYVSPETEFAFNKDGYYRQEIPR